MKLTKTVLNRPIAVIVIIAGLFIFGIASVFNMNLQLIPDMEMPMLIVQTVYPQAGPEEVERLVTKEIEKACGSLSGMDSIISMSQENVSLVVVSYDYGTNTDNAFIDLQTALETVKSSLPDDCKEPAVIKMDINSTATMELSVDSSTASDVDSFVEETLKPELEKISAIASVDTSGEEENYISVSVIPEKLSQYGLSISSIAQTVKSANFVMPAGTKEYGIYDIDMSTSAEYKTPKQIANIPLTTATGETIHLSDIALVNYSIKDPDSLSRFNGSENVGISIKKEQSASAVTVSNKVKSVIKDLAEKYPEYSVVVEYDSAKTIISALKSIGETLALGVVLTMLILFIFFGDFKGSLIVGSSMPISLLITLLLMSFSGFSLNMMTMGGLVIAIGMMVDNSIVVIEMCFRKKEEIEDFKSAAAFAVETVLTSIIASTVTTIVVYLPLSLSKGLSGQMFNQLGLTIVFALIASLISAITVVPLCFAVYKPREKQDLPINRFLDKFNVGYGKVLYSFLNKKKLTAFVSILIVGTSVYLAQFVHTELMTSTDEGLVTVTCDFRPGTNKEIVDAKVQEIEAYVKSFDYISDYSATVETAKGTVNAYVASGAKETVKDVIDLWTEDIQKYAQDCDISLSAGSSMGSSSMSGSSNGYTVTYSAVDLDTVKAFTEEALTTVSNTPGVISVSSTLGNTANKAEIQVDPIKASANYLTPSMVGGTIYAMMNGTDAYDVVIDDKTYTVTVEYPKGTYETVNDVYNVHLTNTRGQAVPLRDVADIVYTDSPSTIRRTDNRYEVSVTATMKEADKYTIQDAIDANLEKLTLPTGVERAESTREKMMKEEFGTLGSAILASIVLVYMVMAIEFEDLRYSGVVMICIPFAVIGSVLFLVLTNSTLNMTSMLGFMMLIGIVVNNGILYVDYTNLLRHQGMKTIDALVETGKSRLRPILMTTLTTILSMVPLGIGIGKNGEVMKSMALVIIGGLLTSTILTLLVLPVFYMIVHTMSVRKINKRKAKEEEKALRDNNGLEVEDLEKSSD